MVIHMERRILQESYKIVNLKSGSGCVQVQKVDLKTVGGEKQSTVHDKPHGTIVHAFSVV